MLFRNYDPALYVVTFGNILFTGFAEGTFIAAERAEDAFTAVAGVNAVTRVRMRNRIGSVTTTIMAESPTNDQLSALAAIDEASGLGVRPLLVRNLNGGLFVQAEAAWIRKLPVVEAATDASNREWVIDCADMDKFVGGAAS